MNFKKSYISLLTAALLLSGSIACDRQPARSDAPKNIVSNTGFQSEGLAAERYESVTGLAVYGSAGDIKVHLAALAEKAPDNIDRFFLLLNSKAPNQAILVQAPDVIPAQAIEKQISSKVTVTGSVKSVNCPDLDSFISKNFGTDLAKTAQGELAYIAAEAPFDFNLEPASEKKQQKVEISLEGTPLGAPAKPETESEKPQPPAAENAESDGAAVPAQTPDKPVSATEQIKTIEPPPVSQGHTVQAKALPKADAGSRQPEAQAPQEAPPAEPAPTPIASEADRPSDLPTPVQY
ncbi:hypothetical protein IJT93_00750 [bacterium]|nr:hypothetical protein [bacterium]